jgi:hypothetical protein
MDVLQLYTNYTVLALVGSSLAIVCLSFAPGSTSRQIKLIGELRTSVERTRRSCDLARSAAIRATGEAFSFQGIGSILAFPADTPENHFVDQANQLIRALASATADTDDLQLSALRQRIAVVRRIEADCHALMSAMEIGQRLSMIQPSFSDYPADRLQRLVTYR